MLLCDLDEGSRGRIRFTPALLPVLKRTHRNAEELRELGLSELGFLARPDNGVGIDREAAPRAASLEIAESLNNLLADIPGLLPFRNLLVNSI